MSIVDAKPDHVDIHIYFFKPMETGADIEFKFEPAPAGTNVSWIMNGHNSFGFKLFQLFMDLDQSVGRDFERGLSALKEVSEARS